MNKSDYHTSDLSFAAFIEMKGNTIKDYMVDNGGKFYFYFDISSEHGERLRSEFRRSDLSIFDGHLKRLREIIKEKRYGTRHSSGSQG